MFKKIVAMLAVSAMLFGMGPASMTVNAAPEGSSGNEQEVSANEEADMTKWVEKHKRSPVLWSAIQYERSAQIYSDIENQIKWLKEDGFIDLGYEFAVLDGWLENTPGDVYR